MPALGQAIVSRPCHIARDSLPLARGEEGLRLFEPAILLLDEPSAGLNRDDREDLARFILRIKHKLGLPMIWIEHDMRMVADLADRIHVLNYGRTLAEAAPKPC
jgi:ABC-type branched-subunit amino acid transport system ATPase component